VQLTPTGEFKEYGATIAATADTMTLLFYSTKGPVLIDSVSIKRRGLDFFTDFGA
jgi:hypothetical protein